MMHYISKEDGVTIAPATQRDIDEVEEDFRDGELAEHEACGGGRTLVKDFEKAYAIFSNGTIVGYAGTLIPGGESHFSHKRIFSWMGCNNCDRHKKAFVKHSRAVLAYIVKDTPEWVNTFMLAALKDYRQAILWLTKLLKFKPFAEFDYNGHKFVMFDFSKKEVING